MSSLRNWIFRILTLIAGGLWVYTWFQPWWIAYIEELKENAVVISPNSMVLSGTLRSYPHWIIGYEMPVWFWPMMWVFLAVYIGLLVYSLFNSARDVVDIGKVRLTIPQLLVAFTGLSFIVFVVVFPIVITLRAPDFHGVVLQGSVFISMDEHTESFVITKLQLAYWIACGTAVYTFALGLLHKVIVGKPTRKTA